MGRGVGEWRDEKPDDSRAPTVSKQTKPLKNRDVLNTSPVVDSKSIDLGLEL
jgi:hypothetical protein